MMSKNRFRCLITLLIIALSSFNVSAVIYKGRCVFPDSLQYPYTVSLFRDSGLITQKNCHTDTFTISSKEQASALKILALGFDSVSMSLPQSATDTVSLQTIHIQELSHALDEVVVVAQKATIKRKGMDFSISNIKGSYIGEAGNLIDMLSWTPGISVTYGDNISVAGRGTPLIYINGVKASAVELHSLSSSNVSKIEVIRNPGSEYPMGTTSVINITTSTPINEMINVELYDRLYCYNAVSNNSRVSSFGRIKNINFNASISYSPVTDKQSYLHKLETFDDNGDRNIYQEVDGSLKTKNNAFRWFIGANYTTKNKSTFLLQYSGSSMKTNTRSDVDRRILELSEFSEDPYSLTRKSDPTAHRVTGLYSTKINGGSLKVTLSYQKSNQHTSEDTVNLSKVLSSYNYKYQLFTIKGDYTKRISSFGSHSMGVYLGYTDNKMSYADDNKSQYVSGNGKWVEPYYSINGNFDKFDFRGGIRGRYEQNVTTENYSNRNNLQYKYFTPNISIGYTLSEACDINASYYLYYRLPSFRQINPAIRVSDKIFYTQGNPDLKNSKTHRIDLAANIKNVTIIAEYNNYHKNIINITEPYGDGTFITRPQNADKSSQVSLALEYTSVISGKLRLNCGIDGGRTSIRYQYLNSLIESTNYYSTLSLNTSYKLGAFSVFANGRYMTPFEVNNKKVAYTLNVNLGGDCTLKGGKFYLRLEVADLFRRSVTPFWETYSPWLYEARTNRYDTRGVSLSFRYRFTGVKTTFKQAASSSDAQRLN